MASKGYKSDLLSSVDNRAQIPTTLAEENEEDTGELICEACDPEDVTPDQVLHFCYACDFVFCEQCWKAQLPHRKNRQATSGVVHEKTNPWIAKKVQSALSPPADEKSYAKLCMRDEHTSWFGIDRENRQGEPLIFHDTGRYAELMASTKDQQRSQRVAWNSEWSHMTMRDTRAPSLVSFVGQSGAGKSTLINLLITFKGGPNREQLPSPVVGMTGKDVPTSEDVHLYSDPATCLSDNPLLYADCEGLDGGEREPVKSRLRKTKDQGNNRQSQVIELNSKVRHNSERELLWADTVEKRSRQFAVAHLYPRLLFTFSDTIVFVLKNPRVIEGVFEKLVEWAAAALETSSNQPVLPCAIIALNASEINIDEALWDVEYATTQLLESLMQTVQQNPSFQRYAEFWTARNKQIETLEQLVLCYYSSIKIVRIPAAGRPKLIQEQVEKLYHAIDEGCKFTRERKRSLRMLLDAAELQSYLQCAFDHFAQTLDIAFDFVQASFINNPIPFDFGGNILRLAISIKERQTPKHGRADPKAIFKELSTIVASCIMLDSVRHEIRGNAERIFPEYINHLESALEDFCDRHWPCEFVAYGAEYPLLMRHLDGITGHHNLRYIAQKSQCVNVRAGHSSKGHQTADGTIFHSGEYFSEFSWESYHEEFYAAVYFRLDDLMGMLDERTRDGTPAEIAAAAIHRDETLAPFYRSNLKNMNQLFQSHSVCLCCLFEQPEHVLPCGHILCTSCVKSYGRMKSKTLIEIRDCPLEPEKVGKYNPSTVYLKPEMAAHRVLVLDGGGIRAMVQLEVLRRLEREWHGKLPIRCFFDLVVGTGTGALIALGLVMRYWSLDKCSYYIERILNDAYARRPGRGIPGIGRLLETYSKSKFDSSSLDNALKEAFPDAQYLFGGRSLPDMPASAIKVAVTATASTGSPIVFANYNRRCSDFLPYSFCRPDKLEQELKVWQAARASMATPKLFKPFRHHLSKQIYTAADISYRNPIAIADRERKLLSNQQDPSDLPDLVLSLGTGMQAQPRLTSSGASVRTATPSVVGSLRSLGNARDPLRRASSPARCQMASDDFANGLSTSQRSSSFIRFNPVSMMSMPSADDLPKMKHLQSLVRSHIDAEQIKNMAARLLATVFYFEPIENVIERADGTFMAQGYILCRLPNQTQDIANLGKLLREKSSLIPQFIVRETETISIPQRIDIDHKTTGDMILDQQFRMPPVTIVMSTRAAQIEIALHMDGDEGHPISGFPRTLARVEKKVMRHRQALAAVRPGTAIGTIKSGSCSGSASTFSRSSKPWSPPDPERHPSLASVMSPTASVMSLAPTVSTAQTFERETVSVDYPQTPATTVTNQSFPVPEYQVSSISDQNPTTRDGRETAQQRVYATYRPRLTSLTMSDSGVVPENGMNNSNASLGEALSPKTLLDENTRTRQKNEKRIGPYELDATPTSQKLAKTIYSPFPLRRRKSSLAREDGSQPPDSSNPPERRFRSGEIPRGDSPVLGVGPTKSSREEKEAYGKSRPPPLTPPPVTPPPPIPQDRVIRGHGKHTVRSDLPLRMQPDNLTRRDTPPVPPPPLVQPGNATRLGESMGVNLDGHVQMQRGMPHGDFAVKKAMGIYNENQERLRSEDGMPLELRLRKLEGLVKKLEAENAKNAKTAEKLLGTRVGSEGYVASLMK